MKRPTAAAKGTRMGPSCSSSAVALPAAEPAPAAGGEVATKNGIAGGLYYLFAYVFMVVGSFTVMTLVGRRGDARHDLDAYRGLSARNPGLALLLALFLMAQAGIPFTTGFLAKFYVISAAVDSGAYPLALIAMIAAVIAAFFYLRVIVLMYSPPAEGEAAPRLRLPRTMGVALAGALAVTLVIGLYPAPVIDFARHATLLF